MSLLKPSLIEIWTDGACIPNPGYGGWAWVSKHDFNRASEPVETTNNRMELMAIIKALEYYPRNTALKIYSDSKYCVLGGNRWIGGWEKRKWKNVKNKDLWQSFLELKNQRSPFVLEWVRGHNGNKMNEKADALANKSAIEASRLAKGDYNDNFVLCNSGFENRFNRLFNELDEELEKRLLRD